MPAELVRCVMAVTDPRRLRLARIAIDAFVTQAYSSKKLILVNALPGPRQRASHLYHPDIIEIDEPAVRPSDPDRSLSPLEQFYAERGHVLVLRSAEAYASRMFGKGWTCVWHDDACHHPFRLAYQMAHAVPLVENAAGRVRLGRQIRLNIYSSNAFYHEAKAGIPGTEIADRRVQCGRLHVIDNDGEAAKLSIAFLDAPSTTADASVDGWLPGPGCSSLSPADAAYLAAACVPYGLDVRPSGNDAARRTLAAGAATGIP